ncbi:MAG: hypothetical protein E6I97_18700 [Chloroflexi bacterium]|nr:MAG: hypothetical protein E6I97_18700 [Chloroflexota bacterium]
MERLDGSATHGPPSNPRQASTRLERAPASISILVQSGDVTVQQMTEHDTSLHSVSLRRVTRDEEIAREEILLQ